MQPSSIIKSPNENVQNEFEYNTHSDEARFKNSKEVGSEKVENDQTTPTQKETRLNKEDGYEDGPYQRTNNRMTVPLQKKPKKSFEEALVGVVSPEKVTKRHALIDDQKNNKSIIKRPLEKVTILI